MTTTHQRGEEVRIMLEAPGKALADLSIVSAITAPIKPARYGEVVPAETVPVIAQFSVDPVEAQGGLGAGWVLSLSGEQSEALAPGLYATNARLIVNGAAVITEPRFFRMTDAI